MTDVNSKLPRVWKVLDQDMERKLHIGGQLYVSIHEEVVVDCVWGEARQGVPMRKDTIMPWLSAGKPLTAVVVAQLEEEKQLKINDPVSRYLPEFGILGKEGITVRHVLTHTGGFRPADRMLQGMNGQAALDFICQTSIEPGWTPGEKAGYHVLSGWFILGEIISRVMGRPASLVYRSRLFSPLGLDDSWVELPPDQYEKYGPRMGQLHGTFGGEIRPHPDWWIRDRICQFQPGSSSCGPIYQLGQFYESLLVDRKAGGNRLLKEQTVTQWTHSQRIGLFDHTFQHTMDWGLGFMVNSNRYGAETVPYSFGRPSSDSVFGHGGSQSSCGFADPVHGLVVAWIVNGMPGEPKHQSRAREINSAIYQDLGLG